MGSTQLPITLQRNWPASEWTLLVR